MRRAVKNDAKKFGRNIARNVTHLARCSASASHIHSLRLSEADGPIGFSLPRLRVFCRSIFSAFFSIRLAKKILTAQHDRQSCSRNSLPFEFLGGPTNYCKELQVVKTENLQDTVVMGSLITLRHQDQLTWQ